MRSYISEQDNTTISEWLESSQPLSDLLYFCWAHVGCDSCLDASPDCSWCATSATCIPNHSSFPLLEPFLKPDICPLGARERWELRAQPLGCNVSTMTFLSVISAIVSTLAFVAFIGIVFFCIKTMIRACAREIHGVRFVGTMPAYSDYSSPFERPVHWNGIRDQPRRVIRRRSMVPGSTIEENTPLLV